MSKILFVVTRPLEINTSASIRNKSMIEGLIQNGHTVDLVTAEPNVHHAAYDGSLSVQGVNAIRIAMNNAQRLAGLGGNNKLFLKLKSLAYKWVTRHEVYDHLKSLANHTDSVNLADGQYDYIISSSDPKSSHLFVLKLLEQQGRNFKGKWIQIWGDPFFADITQTNRNKRIIKNEEQRLLQGADYVFYVSQMTLAQQKKLYPTHAAKMRYTPIPYVHEKTTTNRRLKDAATIELAYCGDYSPRIRNLIPLYDTVNSCQNLHLVICGGSDAPLHSTNAVRVAGRAPYSVTCEVEDKADILVFLANRSGAQIPGKVYQYAGTNKPILFILDGDAQALRAQFERYGRFVFVENTPESILQGVKEIAAVEKNYMPIKEFSREYIMGEFMKEVSTGI